MTYELVYYLFITTIGLVFCFTKIKSDRVYTVLTFTIFVFYSIITRYSGFDIDINTYASALKSEMFSIYYLREPVYWISSRYVFKLTRSPEITFIIYDMISFFLVLKARKNMGLPQYFPYLFLLFFPSVMGMNNVYRQYFASSIFIYWTSLLFVHSSIIKKSFFIILAVLTHNISALFSPLLFTINKKKHINFKSVFIYMCVIVLLPIAVGTKSNSDTGVLSAEAYIFVLLMIFIFYILSYRMKFNDISAKFFYFFIYTISLTTFSAVLMGSAQSKRVGMYSLIVCLVPLVKAIEDNYKQKIFVRMIVYITLILPTLLFSSSLDMLLTVD